MEDENSIFSYYDKETGIQGLIFTGNLILQVRINGEKIGYMLIQGKDFIYLDAEAIYIGSPDDPCIKNAMRKNRPKTAMFLAAEKIYLGNPQMPCIQEALSNDKPKSALFFDAFPIPTKAKDIVGAFEEILTLIERRNANVRNKNC